MDPANGFQLLRDRALQSKAQPVDPYRMLTYQLLPAQRSRIRFNRNLRLRSRSPDGIKLMEQSFHKLFLQQGWRTASQKYSLYFIILCRFTVCMNFLYHCIHILRLPGQTTSRKGQKITVMTFLHAERYMQI